MTTGQASQIMKAAIALTILTLVGGCDPFMIAANRATIAANRDDRKCLSYGAMKGDAAYVQCRSQLEAARMMEPEPVSTVLFVPIR